MSIKATFFVIFSTLLCLLGGLVFVMYLIVQNQGELSASEVRRYESYKIADELRQSSDDLTRMARTYVVTGDPRFEQYFYDILAIRSGQKPRPLGYDGIYWDFLVATGEKPTEDRPAMSLEQRMRNANFIDIEFRLLAEAQRRSNNLARIEGIAMNAVKGRFDDGSGQFVIEKNPDPVMAQGIMHGQNYHLAKGGIMEPIHEFFRLVEGRTENEVQTLREACKRYTQIAIGLVGLIVVFSVFSFFLLQRRMINPIRKLVEGTHRIIERDYSARIDLQSYDELGELAHAFNFMAQSLARESSERK
ncbi:MAG: HAMP domain-containing protein [Gammaproteobacteria bacterium]|nr:HAMP domain-containing protein [Gammaproteobacteria bacterium]MCI0590530.1 HAMP domain-containing protein [Gammaproteobacteria bacterium]